MIKLKRNMLTIVTAVFVSILIVGWIAPVCSFAGDKVYKWKMPSFLPRGTAAEKVREQWCKDVAVATNGRIQIQYFGAGELLPPLQMWDAVKNGVIPIAFSYGSLFRGKTPLSMYSEGMCFTAPDLPGFHALLYEYGLENIIRKSYAKKGVHLLRVLPCLYSTMIGKFDFNTIDDLKKYKIRTGGPIAELLKEADVPTVYISSVDIYSSMQRGVIDATIGGPISYFYDLGFHEVSKYVLIPGIGPEADEIIMNPKVWKSLPKDLQMILYQCTADLTEKITASYTARDQKLLTKMKNEGGIKPIYLSDKVKNEMSEYMMKAADKIGEKDPDFAEATKVVRGYLQTLGKIK